MLDFLYVVKMLIFTIIVVFLLQIKIGTSSIEQHSLRFLRGSTAVHELNGVAKGAMKVMSRGYNWVVSTVGSAPKDSGTTSASQGPVDRLKSFQFHRSDGYYEQVQKKAMHSVETLNKEAESASNQFNQDLDAID
jgi:hypothetical protein